MKKLIGVIVISLFMVVGCDNSSIVQKNLDSSSVLFLRGHHYISNKDVYSSLLAHSGNCPCWKKRHKELKELIIASCTTKIEYVIVDDKELTFPESIYTEDTKK